MKKRLKLSAVLAALMPVESRSSRRSGFTLVEIMVAIAILGVLLTVILVPLRLGFETFTVGKSRSETQQQAQILVNRIADDLRKSQFVFSNSYIEGINNNVRPIGKCSPPPYPATADPNWASRPYIRSNDAAKNARTDTFGVCDAPGNTSGVQGWNNPTRIDMLQQRRTNDGNVMNTDAGQDFIITYYPRRLDITKPFDLLDNPIVLYRAQVPFRSRAGNGTTTPFMAPSSATSYNADVDTSHLPQSIGNCDTTANPAQTNRSFQWLNHNYFGEADLEPLAVDAPGVPGAHTLVTPRDMSLVAPRAAYNEPNAYVPELSFREESSDGRVIDRVVITLTLAQYDQSGTTSNNNQAAAQRIRVSQTVEIPSAAACSVQ